MIAPNRLFKNCEQVSVWIGYYGSYSLYCKRLCMMNILAEPAAVNLY